MELGTIDPGSLDNGLRNNGFGTIDPASKTSQQWIAQNGLATMVCETIEFATKDPATTDLA